MPTITDAAPKHIDAIARLWHDGWHDAHAVIAPHSLARLRTPPSFQTRSATHLPKTRVALSSDQLLGFCISADSELYQLYVAEAARGTGTAQALVTDAETRIAAAGHQTAWLACAIGNARAARFYEKCGWTNVRTEAVDLETSDGPFSLDVWRFEKSVQNR